MTASWYLSPGLVTLRDEIGRLAPNRSKLSDGSVGDTSHSARASDHNPNHNPLDDIPDNMVCAIDITHDPANGCDSQELFDSLMAGHDSRLDSGGYLIWNKHIWNPRVSSAVRPYQGQNLHTKHIHVSIGQGFTNTTPWRLDTLGTMPVGKPSVIVPALDPAIRRPILRKGSHGAEVGDLQAILAALGLLSKGGVDSILGPMTEAAVKAFQKGVNLKPIDGVVGPYTWAALVPLPVKPVPSPTTNLGVRYKPSDFPATGPVNELWGTHIEKFMARPYDDFGTIAQGFGHNASSGVPPIPLAGGAAWTRDYAVDVFRKDMALQVHYLSTYCKVPLLQREIDGFALDIFQMGPGKWKNDKVLALINVGDIAGAAQWMKDRPDIPGLDRRRDLQRKIVLGLDLPDPASW